MRVLDIDIETYSSVSLPTCGVYKYVDSPDFEILLFGYAFDDEPAQTVDLACGEEIPAEVLAAIWDSSVEKRAWNANFERTCIGKYFGRYCPPEQWFDPMVLASSCGLPLTLEAAGSALGLDEDKAKMKIGKQLIRYFSLPCKPTKKNGQRTRNLPEHDPENWKLYKEYNTRDVEAEITICNQLIKWRPSRSEHKLWCLDQQINDRGVRVDRTLAENAIRMGDEYKSRLMAQATELSGLVNPNSTAQVKMWLEEQEGLTVPSLNKKVIADVVAQLTDDNAKKFMALRSEFSKSSTKKYEAIARSVCDDGHVHGCFQFAGAGRTGRWAGRLVQFQNLPQNHMTDLDSARWLVRSGDDVTLNAVYPDVSSTLSELIRTALIPEDGHRFIVADYSAIEARVIAWIAGEDWRLKVFENGGDIYCASASQMFKVPVVKHGENGHLRQKGKIAELALGYGGGVNALKAFGADKSMTDEEMVETVDLWRAASPRICALWKSIEKAAIRCVVRKEPVISVAGSILFEYEDGVMWMTLPSGRRIAYWGMQYSESGRRPGKTLSYMGTEQTTRKWMRLDTWGGKLVENCLSKGTLVLTDRGLVPIEQVRRADRLWDGEQWVEHSGLICKGRKSCIEIDGVWMTPEHKVLTKEGWVNAEACKGLERLQVRLPDDYRPLAKKRFSWQTPMGVPVCLRQHWHDRHEGCNEAGTHGAASFLWLPKGKIHIRGSANTWNVPSSCLCSMAFDDSALHKPKSSCVEKLRWAWNNRVRVLASKFREFLERHGQYISNWLGYRPNRQQQRLLRRKLPLDNTQNELPQSEMLTFMRVRRADNERKRGIRVIGHMLFDPDVPNRTRSIGQAIVQPTRRVTEVYDLMNAGQRHRFVVVGEKPLIVHNCVQATARDCLKESMLALSEEGYDIRAHVHDEVIITEPIGGRNVEDVCTIMGRNLPWAEGLPLRGDGYECGYYMKD